jgi:hypothetical protein
MTSPIEAFISFATTSTSSALVKVPTLEIFEKITSKVS